MEKVAKSGYNQHQKYSYSNEADLHDVLKPALAEQGISIIWSVESVEFTGELCLVRVKYTLVDIETNEKVEVFSVGTGIDKQDKAIYKAMTGAHKYFIMKCFLVSTDDDPENDAKTTTTKSSGGGLGGSSKTTKSTSTTKSSGGGFGSGSKATSNTATKSSSGFGGGSTKTTTSSPSASSGGFGGKTIDNSQRSSFGAAEAPQIAAVPDEESEEETF